MLTVTLFSLSSFSFMGNKLKLQAPLVSVWPLLVVECGKTLLVSEAPIQLDVTVSASRAQLRNLTSAVCFSMCCRLVSTTRQTLQSFYSQGLSATLWLLGTPMIHCAPYKLQTSAEPASQTSRAAVYRFPFLHLSLFLSIRLVLQQTFVSHVKFSG